MTVDVAQQSRALCQALLLGGAMGVTYDLFRVLRVSKKAIDNAGDAFAGENTGGEHKKIQGGTNK